VIGLVVLIIVLAVAVIASFAYLIFVTVVQTQKLCRAYVRKAMERHNFQAGHLYVVHLEEGSSLSNTVTRTPAKAHLTSSTPKENSLREPLNKPAEQEMW